ncbi:uncharacterized protein PHACADRAFT_213659 [Phanerochaete carnosa HHB-10118-sp]|uniref:Uncharacterized protein n=1 Tax=Phanerochaete carnosa (strain HHB-10118-sp) TaxID=650164 RepID=K5VW44_PHACS|nr:uncharacterized protein PHACADRAFT_213659 [Phanerochaete carnosa HHB-10118-sp]EKM50784.1 hypothetical protein PHACADRAFT_213659 [Phanerochaete carnosa HHB-10118-sp]
MASDGSSHLTPKNQSQQLGLPQANSISFAAEGGASAVSLDSPARAPANSFVSGAVFSHVFKALMSLDEESSTLLLFDSTPNAKATISLFVCMAFPMNFGPSTTTSVITGGGGLLLMRHRPARRGLTRTGGKIGAIIGHYEPVLDLRRRTSDYRENAGPWIFVPFMATGFQDTLLLEISQATPEKMTHDRQNQFIRSLTRTLQACS